MQKLNDARLVKSDGTSEHTNIVGHLTEFSSNDIINYVLTFEEALPKPKTKDRPILTINKTSNIGYNLEDLHLIPGETDKIIHYFGSSEVPKFKLSNVSFLGGVTGYTYVGYASPHTKDKLDLNIIYKDDREMTADLLTKLTKLVSMNVVEAAPLDKKVRKARLANIFGLAEVLLGKDNVVGK